MSDAFAEICTDDDGYINLTFNLDRENVSSYVNVMIADLGLAEKLAGHILVGIDRLKRHRDTRRQAERP